jgi:hypothetical protein
MLRQQGWLSLMRRTPPFLHFLASRDLGDPLMALNCRTFWRGERMTDSGVVSDRRPSEMNPTQPTIPPLVQLQLKKKADAYQKIVSQVSHIG